MTMAGYVREPFDERTLNADDFLSPCPSLRQLATFSDLRAGMMDRTSSQRLSELFAQ
jgi:hypothetical protein